MSDAVTGIIPLFCRGQALDVLILDGVTQFCSIGKNRCAVQRKGQLSKDGKQFFPIGNFDNALKFIDSLINEYYRISSADIKSIAQKLAEILDNINYLHPFREGNGRTQREFLRLLALEKGFHLNLNPPDNKNVYDRYMKGTVESDLDILTTLIFESLNSKDERKNGT